MVTSPMLSFVSRSSVMVRRNCAIALGQARSLNSYSAWKGVQMAPADPIIGLTQSFKDDTAPSKVLLGVGAYRDGDGNPVVLPSVKAAEERVIAELKDHEYAPISGVADFLDVSLKFVYGTTCEALKSGRIAAVQALSGTGACRIAAHIISKLPAIGGAARGKPVMYMPTPTWSNHLNIAAEAGIEVRMYRYLDERTKTSLDFRGLIEDLETKLESGTSILLHACAHNPTGVDPSREQWAEMSRVLKAKNIQIFFDCAYQGFASGDAENDAWAIRKFVQDGHKIMVAQSYAKNFGLYGERVGALSAVCDDVAEAKALESQLKAIIRPMYSSPPVHGARVVSMVLSDPKLRSQWTEECKMMADRIRDMRSALQTALVARDSTRDWSHITSQIGMFAFTGLTKEQVLAMRERFHIYCTLDGRISVAGLNLDNVEYVADAMHQVTSS